MNGKPPQPDRLVVWICGLRKFEPPDFVEGKWETTATRQIGGLDLWFEKFESPAFVEGKWETTATRQIGGLDWW